MVKSKKRCFISEEFRAQWPFRSLLTKQLILEEVDALSAFAEAYVLHDQVRYISDGGFPTTLERVIRSLPGSTIVSRYGRLGLGRRLSEVHRLFRGAVNPSLRADLDDLDIALRALRRGLQQLGA